MSPFFGLQNSDHGLRHKNRSWWGWSCPIGFHFPGPPASCTDPLDLVPQGQDNPADPEKLGQMKKTKWNLWIYWFENGLVAQGRNHWGWSLASKFRHQCIQGLHSKSSPGKNHWSSQRWCFNQGVSPPETEQTVDMERLRSTVLPWHLLPNLVQESKKTPLPSTISSSDPLAPNCLAALRKVVFGRTVLLPRHGFLHQNGERPRLFAYWG